MMVPFDGRRPICASVSGSAGLVAVHVVHRGRDLEGLLLTYTTLDGYSRAKDLIVPLVVIGL